MMESWKGHLIVEEGAEGGIGTAGVNICPINSQSLEDTQVGYISQKYTFDKYT